ncbi:MAG: ABC transporter permease [Gemmatimonadetes bacterium]|nr:ABC transporter permease [Gemmatimonadota bacterium]
MSFLRQDLQYALRTFAQRPGYTAVLVLTLALGIGGIVAIFSVANAVLFRPLPFKDPEQLVLVWNRLANTNVDRALVSGPDFIDYQQQTTMFEDFAAAVAQNGTLTGEGRAEQVLVGWTTVNFLDVLGVSPMVGRDFDPEDAPPIDPQSFADPNATFPPGALILSHGLWQRRFGSDRNVLGLSLQVDGQECIIVGVMPRDFRIYLPPDAGMATDIDIWRAAPENMVTFADRATAFFTVVARLKAGVTVAQGQAEMDRLATTLREQYQYHARSGMHITVNSMHEDIVAHVRPLLMAVLAAAGFVLLIACANVANLLLVRAASREREIAVRAALGGGRGRIIRQMLTESAVFSIAGGALGLLLAWWGNRALVAMRPENLPRLETIGIDGTVLAFTVGATVLAALLFGMAPALKATSPNLANALNDRGSQGGGTRGNKIRTTLVVAEVALSLVLLVGAGLMLRSFSKIRQVEPGFDAENLLTFSVPLPLFKYRDPDGRADFYERLYRRIEGLPGVQRVGGVVPLPLSGGDQYLVYSYGTSDATEEQWAQTKADYKAVLPGYLEAIGAQIVSGRFLSLADNQAGARRVVVIDEKLAERAWPDEDPLGKQLHVAVLAFDTSGFRTERVPAEVVGVVRNIRAESLTDDGREAVYFPFRWFPWFPLSMTVRTAGNPLALAPLIRREIEIMDPEVPMADIRLMDDYIAEAAAQTRFTLTLISVFAAMALVLASIGLYGVISYSVRQRTREIGVRMAFGADEKSIVRLVVRRGMALGLAGVGVGIVVAFVLTRTVSSLLYGVSAIDPVTFLAIPLVLVAVTVIASYVPARRATRVNPVEALRDE